MATSVTFTEFNGAGQASSGSRGEMNLKNIDDSTTAYSSSPISTGASSFWKYQAALHSGTFNQLSVAFYKVSSNAPATAVAYNGGVASSYVTPATTAFGGLAAMSTTGTGASANFTSSSSPFAAGTATYTTAGNVYAQALILQAAVGTGATTGDWPSVTITYGWTES